MRQPFSGNVAEMPIVRIGSPKEGRAATREVAKMRMRDQLVVVVAVTVATVAVAANVFAQTRAADQRVEMEQAGLAADWSYPVVDITTLPTRADPDDIPGGEYSGGDGEGTESRETAPCTKDSPCTIEEVLEQDFRNHGQMVSAYVRALGFEEGVDGPRGSYVRQIARPDIDDDGPPRSDQAAANQKDKDTPPGQDKDRDKDTPPGQDKDD
jgi:hypothetical protein